MILFLLFVPAIFLFGYQSALESKGINDPTLAISLYKTGILLDISVKLLLLCFTDEMSTISLVSILTTLVFYLQFFVPLSLNIPKKSFRKIKKYPLETNYTICAVKVVVWFSLSTLFNALLLISTNDTEIIAITFFMVGTMILYMVFAARSLVRLDRLKFPSTRSLHALSKNNSPIVLLRSFKLDSNPTINGKVFDEDICENLDLENNPIISLANPDEILPSGGSLKIQAKDAEWKEVVKKILANCRAVILVEGLSEGLHWEISKLKEFLNPRQLYVMIPSRVYRELAWCYNDDAGTGLYSITRNAHRLMTRVAFTGKKDRKAILDAIWSDFSLKLQEFGIHTPDSFPGDNTLLAFDEVWNCKKLENVNGMNQMMNHITAATKEYNNSVFDYQELGKKIAEYEVNGFLDKKDVLPFQQIVDKCNKRGRIAAIICFAIFIATALLS